MSAPLDSAQETVTRTLQIGEVASLTGLSLRTIRHYEEVGVIGPSRRTPGGFRLYSDGDVDRLRKVMGMKPIGFSLEEIREVLGLMESLESGRTTPAVEERLRWYADLAAQRLEKHTRRLATASAFTELLRAVVDPGPSTVSGEPLNVRGSSKSSL